MSFYSERPVLKPDIIYITVLHCDEAFCNGTGLSKRTPFLSRPEQIQCFVRERDLLQDLSIYKNREQVTTEF